MKYNVFIIIILTFVTARAVGQNKLKEGSVKANLIVFTCKNGSGRFMEVNNQTNPSINSIIPKDLFRLSDTELKDENSVNAAFLKVFNNQRLKELTVEINMGITFNINRSGKVKFITFRLRKNTLISSLELEALERELKNNVVFIIPKGENLTDNIWPITQFVFFQKLYDRSSVN